MKTNALKVCTVTLLTTAALASPTLADNARTMQLAQGLFDNVKQKAPTVPAQVEENLENLKRQRQNEQQQQRQQRQDEQQQLREQRQDAREQQREERQQQRQQRQERAQDLRDERRDAREQRQDERRDARERVQQQREQQREQAARDKLERQRQQNEAAQERAQQQRERAQDQRERAQDRRDRAQDQRDQAARDKIERQRQQSERFGEPRGQQRDGRDGDRRNADRNDSNQPPADRAGDRRGGDRPRDTAGTPGPRNIEELRRGRRERRDAAGGRTIIEEPGNRVIVRQGDRIVIQRNESERLRRLAPRAERESLRGDRTRTVVRRPGGVEVISITDRDGRLIRRVRRDASGRERIMIDNRRRRSRNNTGRNIAIGAGIGAGVIAGALLLDSVVNVPEPRVRIPRDRYIVDYSDASEDDVYDTLSAPPIEDYKDRYTLDEVRATHHLRQRMRRVDLDDVNFAFGAWDVERSQFNKLERVARAMRRVIRRDPNEVFLVEGHTDAVGSRVDNLSLSDRRAESVVNILVDAFEIPFENLVAQGYGEDYLKIRTEAPDRQNRRVAIRRITPLLDRDNKVSGYEEDDNDFEDERR